MISRAMGARKPGSQGERDISVKTIAQGRPDVSAFTCGSFPVLFPVHGGRGCGGHPAFPAPSVLRGTEFPAKLGRDGAARMRAFESSLSSRTSEPAAHSAVLITTGSRYDKERRDDQLVQRHRSGVMGPRFRGDDIVIGEWSSHPSDISSPTAHEALAAPA